MLVHHHNQAARLFCSLQKVSLNMLISVASNPIPEHMLIPIGRTCYLGTPIFLVIFFC